jgi:uncharacterized membrane protein
MPTLRKYFVTGLLILVPLGITVWVLKLIVTTMDQTLLLLPQSVRDRFPFNLPGTGVILTLAIILTVGMIGRNFIGRKLVLWWEVLLRRIPVVSSIYTSVKQVSDTLFSSSGQAFRKAVLIQFPQPGQWSVAFVVGDPGESIKGILGADFLTIYVPTAPNPTSGYILVMPSKDIVDLNISVDDALKFVLSMGVVTANGREPTRAPPFTKSPIN